MYDRIHVDEKWFFLQDVKQKVYLADDEEQPNYTVRHKSHIPKIMFLCAVARPRYVPTLGKWWDGKIGMWPLAHQVPAKINSKNRPKGTLEWKCLSITGEVYEQFMAEQVLPAIAALPPCLSGRSWRIQEDNAPGHAAIRKKGLLLHKAQELGLNVTMYGQPPNSPDFIVLDLGIFRALDAAYHKLPRHNLDEMVVSVKKAFDEYPREKLNRVFLTLMSCLDESIKLGGGNFYSIPHMNKEKLESEGRLPEYLYLSREAYEKAVE